jgi:peptidyl-prolyl cis-trans isomerase C
MKKPFHEPLLHFLLLGALLFAVFGWKNRTEEPESAGNEIHIGPAQIETLVSTFQKVWQRPPTAEELDGLIKEHLTEEVLYREAKALGLEQNDIVIRRRLRQKMEFLTADVATAAGPDEAALAKYFSEHADQYAESPQLSFTQVYFNREKRGAKLEEDVKASLAELARNPDATADMGDASLLPQRLESTSVRDIGNQFGDEFAVAVRKMPLAQWLGPVESGYGLHLVKVTARQDPPKPQLAKLRDAVLRDYQTVQREELNRRTVEEFKKRYRITVDETAVRSAAAAMIAEGAK